MKNKIRVIILCILIIVQFSAIVARSIMLRNGMEMEDALVVILKYLTSILLVIIEMIFIEICVSYALKTFCINEKKKVYCISLCIIILYGIMGVIRSIITCMNFPSQTGTTIIIPFVLVAIGFIFSFFYDQTKLTKKQKIFDILFLSILLVLSIYGEYDLWVNGLK